ncbi:MAG: TolC family protein [Mangrovibacterium sp.]
MKKFILYIIVLLSSTPLLAQSNLAELLSTIEENNTTLQALRQQGEADKLENKSGIALSNPEVGFNYLWGSPNEIGNRTDFSVSQTFDLATVSGMKNRTADEKNNLVEWQYQADRMNILLEAKQYALDLIYYNALHEEFRLRLQHAEIIAEGYKKRMDKGDVSILEYNKVRLNLATVQGELAKINVERKALSKQLKRLNGGHEISLDDAQFPLIALSPSFEDWYAQAEQQNPILGYVKQEIEVSKRQVSLSKAESLPQISVGYMSEKVVGQDYQGVSAGITIPLWENKNRVKQAKAALQAAEAQAADSKQQFYSQVQILYDRTVGLKTTAESYREILTTANSSELLRKALDAGEISLLEYIVEIGLYYDTMSQALEAERDYQQAFAELSAVEL